MMSCKSTTRLTPVVDRGVVLMKIGYRVKGICVKVMIYGEGFEA